MADRYWRGGSGSWNTTTNWSTTSGGGGGASVPTSADNVIFDTNSGSGTAHYTVTVTDNSTCANLTFTPETAVGVTQFVVSNGFVITGTFSTSSTEGNRRLWIQSSTYGLMRDMRIASIGSVSDVDFRDIRVTGAGGTLSGTRIGDLRGNSGITFSTPKTVYWNLAAGGNWSANAWAATSGGGVSTDNFPLAQDTAVIENTGLNTGATVTVNSAILYIGAVNMSTRTNAMTFANGTDYSIYGNWVNGSGVTLGISNTLTFAGRKTQTITSAGKTFATITLDSYGGTVELADALNIGSNTLTVTNGTFDTKGYAVTAGSLNSNNSNVRAINLGASTVTLSGAVTFTTSTNLSFCAGTSQINISNANQTFAGGGLNFYNVTYTRPTNTSFVISGANTFNNLTITPTGTGVFNCTLASNQTITGTLDLSSASPIQRTFLRSDTLGTQRDLTVGTLVATDCDFRDIDILGAAAGSTPTRAGDCGGNAGITFPSPKTVYWNQSNTNNWSATVWADVSNGSPSINNFPLAQDTAVIDNSSGISLGVTINAPWNIGTFDASGRTGAVTLTVSTNIPFVHGNWLFGTGVTQTSTSGTITFAGRGTQTITSNGVSFASNVAVNSVTGTVQLADALTIGATRTLTLTSGTFDAVSYNVTTGLFSVGTTNSTLKMGSGTWTLSGVDTVWNLGTAPVFYKSTANIVLSNTSTSARVFSGGNLSYNKLTIGGSTGSSTLTFFGNNQFTELASTKTVAHIIDFSSTSQTFGKWSVSGTAGNVVTMLGNGTSHVIAGARVTGVDYLSMNSIGFAATSPGEFYAGANSTGSSASIIKTAAPAAVTRYWRGGTGTWDATTTTNWSATSGGLGGASVPTSADAVVFDSMSNATAYTVTCTATQLRCGSLTMAGPLAGNVTWVGSAPLAIHDNVSLAATGVTRSYAGVITLSGSSTGKTLTTNGVQIISNIIVNGVGCEWRLGSALQNGTGSLNITNGSIDFVTYNYNTDSFTSNNFNTRTISFGSGTTTFNSFNIGNNNNSDGNLTINAGTGQINCLAASPTFSGNGQTFYNVAFTSTSAGTVTLNGANTFNNLSFTGITSAGLKNVSITANQTVNGTLTLSAGTNATMRTFVRSDTIGTTRTLTCAAVSATDVDFRDIIIAGAAAPVSGTRLGDCKGNSGITFDAAKTVYWNLAGNNNWSATGWAMSIGGTPDVNNFPLAQDTAVFTSTSPATGATTTINAAYNIGTIDMSARTTNTMTLATGSTAPFIYGNWINGTGTTITGSGTLTFAGRGSQTITSAGRSFPGLTLTVATIGGSVALQDALTLNSTLNITHGTFTANGYNISISGGVSTNATTLRTINIGGATWTFTSDWAANTSTNLTVTGTGTLNMTGASAKTFNGGGISYSGITLNQGGAGTLTITGNNIFANITNTYKATGATTIALGTTTQRVGAFGASGEAGRVLTVTGTSATSPATLIFTGAGQATTPTTDYLTITGVRAYSLDTTWYAGNNSTNNGSLGWYFVAGVVVAGYLGNFFAFF
jgi:fibronectin-binding autotransporter adhesin